MPEVNQQQNNSDDEILIMDESGEFKVLANGKLKDYQAEVVPLTNLGKIGDKDIQPASSTDSAIKPSAYIQKSTALIDTGMEEKMLQPPPPVVIKKTASFYFHPADEEEAAKHQASQPAFAEQKKYSLDKILEKVIANYKLELSDNEKGRFRRALYNFLRDRRTLVDTESLIKRSAQAGGLNFDGVLAGKLLEFLKEIKEKISRQQGIVVDEKLESLAEASKFVRLQAPVKPLAAAIKPEPLSPIPQATQEDIDLKIKLEDQTRESVKEIQPGPVRSIPRIIRPVKFSGRQLADVKKDYKLVGPVDELASLSLETYRRLGETTKQRAAKVLSRINLLAEDSLAKKTAGIKAWQKSPLYKMYVAVGRASLDYNLDIGQVIKEYGAKGREIITLEEFEAISDINRQLRF